MEQRFIPNEVLSYCEGGSSDLPNLALDIMRRTEQLPNSHMLLGAIIGNLLRVIAGATASVEILEIGTFTGFATAILAENPLHEVHVTSLESDIVNFEEARRNLSELIRRGRVALINSEGISWLETNRSKSFDLILVDASKQSYAKKLGVLYGALRIGGVLIVDNSLAGLGVLAPQKEWEILTCEINHELAKDVRFVTALLPIRDGLTLALKQT